ncbi:MAG: hypothetical protein M3527_01240 [Actinomycetota bacterium]|nr:hypothetical protein [Acidimicrobiia bacterium]MDQ3293065.1 hypothetical protein [Actinomycetota bacterium]
MPQGRHPGPHPSPRATPVTVGDQLPSTRRAPDFNEHGDHESLGLDMDAIIDLKVRGVVA